MAVSTFFPDADPESTSVDGRMDHETANQSWATKRDNIDATAAYPSLSTLMVDLTAALTPNTDLWTSLRRSIVLFDTASLPDGDDISAATFEFVATGRTESLSGQSMSFVSSTPATNTNVVVGDFDQLGTAKQATDVTLASLTVDSATYNVMTLNATGRGSISKTGISKFGARITSENDNLMPTWSSGADAQVEFASAEETLTGDKRPKLVVTHAPPTTFVPKMLVF